MAIQNPERFMAGTVPKSNGLHRGTEAHPPVSSQIQVIEPMESFFARNFIYFFTLCDPVAHQTGQATRYIGH